MSHGLAHHLSDNGFRVVFISHFPYFEMPQIIKNNQGEIIVCSWPTKKRPTNFIDFWWFVKLYFKYKPDFVLGHFVGSNISILLSKILSLGKTQTFEYYHTVSGAIIVDLEKVDWKQKLLFFRKKMFYRWFCDTIICPSEMAKSDLKLFFQSSKGIVIHNPIDDRFENKNIFTNDNIVISFLGRLEPTKGILEMISAFSKFPLSNPDSKIKLKIAGTGSLQKAVQNAVSKIHNTEYLGGLAYVDIDSYLRNSHFGIIPSKHDAFNMVGIECLMHGIPILISKGAGLSTEIIDGVHGYVFDFAEDEMVEIFKKVEFNFPKQTVFSSAARTLFQEKFTLQNYYTIVKQLLQ